jgi:hypothetical protein
MWLSVYGWCLCRCSAVVFEAWLGLSLPAVSAEQEWLYVRGVVVLVGFRLPLEYFWMTGAKGSWGVCLCMEGSRLFVHPYDV